MFLTPETIALSLLNFLIAIFATIAFINGIKIVLYYDKEGTSAYQYNLERVSYLIATIIKFIFYVKIPLFIFFIYTLDTLSNLLPGAMCAAGVVTATVYGTPLLFLKILNLYVFAFWIVLNNEDMKYEDQPYLKSKFWLYLAAYPLLIAEIVLEGITFNALDLSHVVDCCGAIFSTTSQTYMAYVLSISPSILLGIFYGVFLLMILFYFLKNRYIFALLNIIFVIISLITLIAFFGTYIYEQPMHHCPFCLLQKDYNYIGYLLYIVLFIGTFFGFVIGLIDFKREQLQRYFHISLLYNTIYVGVVSLYPLIYFYKNGVWL
jgi:hypothetical protein